MDKYEKQEAEEAWDEYCYQCWSEEQRIRSMIGESCQK